LFEWAKRIFFGKKKPNAEKYTNQALDSSWRSSYSIFGDVMSGGAKWSGGLSVSGRIRVFDHWALRQSARDAYFDTPQANAVVNRYADNVAYTGLKLECAPKIDVLGIELEEAEEWASRVQGLFDLWARSKKQHRSETMSFYQAHRLYQIFQQRDNDIFVRLFYSKAAELLNPVQFEFIDPDQIRGDAFTFSGGPINVGVDDGIVRDDRGREKAYKLWVFEEKNSYKMLEIPVIGARSGRRMMLHGFAPEFAMQGRGFTRLAHVLQEFENLTDFSLSHIKNAIIQSTFPLYVKPSKDQPASNPLRNNISSRGAGSINLQEQAEVTDPSWPYVKYCPLPEVTLDTPGSAGVFNLKEGEDLATLKMTSPTQSYANFVNSFLSSLSASLSVPLEVLLMKFSANYSASRAALLMFWQVANIWRAEMETDFLNPVYEMWLSEEIASGRIVAPGWSDPRLKAAWLNCAWVGAPMPNIDPERTAKADQKYVEMGAQTLDQVSKKYNGTDGRSNRSKLKREISELTVPPWAQKKGE
jgi:lambda family phage portal protein